MKKENQNIEATVVETVEVSTTEVAVEEVKENKFKKALSKTGGFIKKNGLKIALGAGAALGTGLLLMKALRKDDDDVEIYDLNGDVDYDDYDGDNDEGSSEE